MISPKLYFYGGTVIVILVLTLGVVLKWNSMKNEIAEQKTKIETIEKDNKDLKEKNETLTIDIADQQNINNVLNNQIASARKETDALRAKFKNSTYFSGVSLTNSAINNSIDTQQKLNKLTSDLFRCVEVTSGAVLTEEEKDATNVACAISSVTK